MSVPPAVRQADGEGGAVADLAGGLDAALHGLDQVLDDRQAQAGAAQLARTRLVHAVEALEDARQVGLRDADAVVGDFQADLARSLAPARRERGRPSGVYLRALSSRLSRICSMASSSAQARTALTEAASAASFQRLYLLLALGSGRCRCRSRHSRGHGVPGTGTASNSNKVSSPDSMRARLSRSRISRAAVRSGWRSAPGKGCGARDRRRRRRAASRRRALMTVSGVFNSCETLATNSWRSRSRRRRSRGVVQDQDGPARRRAGQAGGVDGEAA